MTPQEFTAKAYTLAVQPEDVVIIHLEYDMDLATTQSLTHAFTDMLRTRGYTNPIVILQPGQMLESLPRQEVLQRLYAAVHTGSIPLSSAEAEAYQALSAEEQIAMQILLSGMILRQCGRKEDAL